MRPADAHRAVVLLALIVVAVAGRLTWSVRDVDAIGAISVPWVLVALGFALTEIHVVHFEHRNEAHSISFSAVPLVVGLFALGPLGLIAARVVGTTLALVVWRRQAPLKAGVNLASFWLADVMALLVFHALVPSELGVAAWPAAFAAALVADQLQALVVTTAIALFQGRFEMLVGPAVLGPVGTIVSTAFALIMVTLLALEPVAVVLLAIGVPALFVSLGVHARLLEKHRTLEQVHAYTRRLDEAMRDDRVIEAVLAETAELMHADRIWLCVQDDAGSLVRVELRDGRVTDPVATTIADRLLCELAEGVGDAVLVSPETHDGQLGPALRMLRARQVLVAPVQCLAGVPATIVVADRSGAAREYVEGDVQVFATLAGHASSTLENDHLVHELRDHAAEREHESRHDALTGLPNRTFFGDELTAALRAGREVSVLMLDLDRFKEVNDTLGHHSGDVLLRTVAERLRGVVRAGDTVARFGGDEFAVLLVDVPTVDAARPLARAISSALDAPLDLATLRVPISASIGIAVAPDHGYDQDTLLSRAEIAMYSAKRDKVAVAAYDPSRDDHSTDRLLMAGAVRAAIEGGQLAVEFQPQIDLHTGDVVGAEALVRWAGDPRVHLSPAELVELAENIGMIRPLTDFVLRAAIAECRAWRADGRSLRVSMNISAHDLLDPTLASTVLRLLAVAGVPASSLCLELTETSVMADPERTIGVLRELHDAGVQIAIDDFGTGYSSLSYLASLPVDELKIDRTFVMDMDAGTSNEMIVSVVVELAQNLGLGIVAEGIETVAARDHLTGIGCDIGQGYLFSPSLPPAAFRTYALRHCSADQVPALLN